MKRPEYHYDQPLVPDHLTKLTVENLPVEKAFYISPGERDSYNDDTAIFVAPDRRLMMSKTYDIDPDDAHGSSPIGRVGISRVWLMNSETMTPRQVIIADLRFLEDHQLVDSDEMKEEMIDQEGFMGALAALEDSVQIDAFIAAEAGEDFDEKNIPKGTFYGNPELYPHLKKLRKRGNKIMKQVLKIEAERGPNAESAEEQPSTEETVPTEQKPTDQTTDLSVKFSHADK